LEALAGYLRNTARFEALEFTPVGKARFAKMDAAFRAAGWVVRTSGASINWTFAPATNNWEDYLSQRPGQLRSTLRRKLKASSLMLDIFQEYHDDIWQSYEVIYAQSWKPEEGSPEILRALARQEGAAGTLRLGLAFDGSTPVAAQFWLVENGIATIHKLAHVEARRDGSPGTILTAAMFRHAIEQDKVRLIDFGTGDDAYKADWMDRREPLYRLSLFNPGTISGILGAARERLSGVRAKIRRAS
jgi:hypothetical protein